MLPWNENVPGRTTGAGHAPIVAILALVATLDPVRLQGNWLMIERHYSDGTVQKYPNGEQTIDHFVCAQQIGRDVGFVRVARDG